MGTLFESERRIRDARELFEYVGRSGESGEPSNEQRTLPAALATLQVHSAFPLDLWSGAAPRSSRLRALYRLAFLLILDALHPAATAGGSATPAAKPSASTSSGAGGGGGASAAQSETQTQAQQEAQASLNIALQHLELAIELAKRPPAALETSSGAGAAESSSAAGARASASASYSYAELLADDSLVMPGAPHQPSLGLLHYLHGRSFASLNRVHDAFVAYRCSIDQLETNADTWCSIGCAANTAVLQPSFSPFHPLLAYILLYRTCNTVFIDAVLD